MACQQECRTRAGVSLLQVASDSIIWQLISRFTREVTGGVYGRKGLWQAQDSCMHKATQVCPCAAADLAQKHPSGQPCTASALSQPAMPTAAVCRAWGSWPTAARPAVLQATQQCSCRAHHRRVLCFCRCSLLLWAATTSDHASHPLPHVSKPACHACGFRCLLL